MTNESKSTIKVTINNKLSDEQLVSFFEQTKREHPEHYVKVTERSSKRTVITCTPRSDMLEKLAKLCPQY